MSEVFVQALTGIGECFLVMAGSGFVLWLGYVGYEVYRSSRDRKP